VSKVEIYVQNGCKVCGRAMLLLDELGIRYDEIAVDTDKARRSEMVLRTVGKRTVPQIFIDDQHIGSLDELMSMEETGELNAILAPAA
jgi:glutaredoxin 3